MEVPLTVHVFWRTTFYRWADIECFGVAFPEVDGPWEPDWYTVGFNVTTDYLDRCTPQKKMKFNRRVLGFNGILPETYGWNAGDLAQHLNLLRARYAKPDSAELKKW